MSENILKERKNPEIGQIETLKTSDQNESTTIDYMTTLSKLHHNQAMAKFHIFVLTLFNALYLTLQYFYLWESFTTMYMFLFGFTYFISWTCMYFMKHMADLHVKLFLEQMKGNKKSPVLDLEESNEVIGSLGGLILYSVIVQMLSLLSNYFWLLLIIKVDYYKFFPFMRMQLSNWF